MSGGTLFLYSIHKWDGSGIVTVFCLLCTLSFNTTSIALFCSISVLDNVKAEPDKVLSHQGGAILRPPYTHSSETCRSYSYTDVDLYGTHTVLFILSS